MCFSPTASFTAAIGLSAIGIVTLKKTRSKREIPFALIPLIFGIQQAVEGVVWLSIYYNNFILNYIASHIFTSFAYIFWPVFVPMAVLCLERKGGKKKTLYILELCGLTLAGYFIYFMTQAAVLGRIVNKCIVYPTPTIYVFPLVGLYVASTCLALVFSSHNTIKWFGFLTTFALIITYEFYFFASVSVWCFFCAILSLVVYMFFDNRRTSRVIKG